MPVLISQQDNFLMLTVAPFESIVAKFPYGALLVSPTFLWGSMTKGNNISFRSE